MSAVTSVSAVETNTLADSTLVVKRYGNMIEFDMDPETVAELFDMVQARWYKSEEIRQIHQIRQDFGALLYRNIRTIYSYREDEWQTALDNDWILEDENGQFVYSEIWPQNYMVDVGNPEYQLWVANWIGDYMKQFEFDGVFADNSLSARAVEHFWGTSSPPINPRTGDFWKDEEVRQALVQVHTAIKNAIGSKVLVCNGIFEGYRFWKRFDSYLEVVSNSPLNGFMSEGLWYQYQGAWMSEERWLDSLEFLVFVQDSFLMGTSRVFVPVCKLARGEGEPYPLPSGCTMEQMATYAFASTLLGVKTNQNYLGIIGNVAFMRDVVQPLYDIALGEPLGEYYQIEGTHIYARDFTNVKVLVNPSEYTFIVDLGIRTISMQPHTGVGIDQQTGQILFGVHAGSATGELFNFIPNPVTSGIGLGLRGVLVDQFGKPIASADVVVEYSTNHGATWSYIWTLKTNQYGVFSKSFNAPAEGAYLVRVTYSGSSTHLPSAFNAYLGVLPTTLVEETESFIRFNFVPNPATPGKGISVKGILFDKLGNHLSYTPVTVEYSTNHGATWSQIWTLKTNQYGVFSKSFNAPAKGAYLVRVTYNGLSITTYLVIP